MKFFRLLLFVQGAYTLVTAIWPIVDINTFMALTGPKNDIWLVKTVGALLIPIALCMFTHLLVQTDHRPVVVLGAFSAAAFITIDFYYALNDVISKVYMLDGVLQILFFVSWVFLLVQRYNILANRQNHVSA